MPPQDRFESLESAAAPLPEDLKSALNRLSRFDALEIGAAAKNTPAASGQTEAPPAAPQNDQHAAGADRIPCVHCGQLNERDRETCWACYRYVRVKAQPKPPADKGPADITIVLDGVTYTSGQKDLPDDIRELMDRIRKNGYSQELLAEWRSWRATRHAAPPPTREFSPMSEQSSAGSDDSLGIKVFRGQRVSVIRLDGKVYTSDDPSLSPELKMLFEYIEAHGVTPALMEHLRQMGGVRLRPPTTAFPSDGDVAFWNSVNASAGGASAAPAGPGVPSASGAADDLHARLSRADAERELQAAQLRYDEARRRAIGAAIGVGFFFLYIIATLFLR